MKSAPSKHQSSCISEPVSDLASDQTRARHFEQIAIAAYFKAEARGFQPGQDIGDWLEAEAESKGRMRE